MTAPSELYGTTQTVSTTERSLPQNAAYSSGSPITSAVFGQAIVSVLSMAVGDQFQVRVLDKPISGSSAQLDLMPVAILNYPESVLYLPGLALLHAWDITCKKLTGTDRTIEFSLRGYS